MWTFTCLLLSSAAMALHPLATDVMSSACHLQANMQKNMVRDTPANVKQEFMITPILSPVPVDHKKNQGASEGCSSIS